MQRSASLPIERVVRQTLTKGRPGSRVTFFPSQKRGEPVACGNLLQADFCVHLEYSQIVQTYECRPPALRFAEIDFKADFLLKLHDGSQVYHRFLLPDDQVYGRSPGLRRAIENQLATCDASVQWLTPVEIPQRLVTSNLRYLYHHSFGSTRLAALKIYRHVMSLADHRATVGSLLARGMTAQDISRAIFSHTLRIDLERMLTSQTVVQGGHDGHL
jgi:hypothetical protein